MITAYLRVSTDKQDLENQEFYIKQYCEDHEIKVSSWVGETITGRKKFRNRKIWSVIEKLSKDDIIIVSEMSRIGRDMFDSIRLLIECMDAGAKLISVKDSYILEDNIYSKLQGILMCFFAEMEVMHIRQRTSNAIQRKIANGAIWGRKAGTKTESYKLDPHLDSIKEMIEEGATKTEIADRFNTTRVTLNKFIEERINA